MKELKKDLGAVAKELRELAQKTGKMIKQVEKLEKAQAAKKPIAKPVKRKVARKVGAKKRTKVTTIDAVLKIIQKRKKGVGTAALKKNTGFDEKKIWNIINNLKKQGKIRSGGRGIYVKA